MVHAFVGADIEIDVPYHYLRFFLEDDAQLEDIGKKYQKGELLTGEIKAILIKILQEFVATHQVSLIV